MCSWCGDPRLSDATERPIVGVMNGLELFVLARKLSKLGMEALPQSSFTDMPVSARTVLSDALENPGTTITAIVTRTGIPQSQVSSAMAHFRDVNVLSTSPDPLDRRRTIVRPAPGIAAKAAELASIPIDEAVARAIQSNDPEEIAQVVRSLEFLSAKLMPKAPAWIHTESAESVDI